MFVMPFYSARHFYAFVIVAWMFLFSPTSFSSGSVDDKSLSISKEAAAVLSFSDHRYEQRYFSLIDKLRCPKCQNQNLADSNAPIAQDLKVELVRLLEEKKSDSEILEFMTLRYGNFVLYQPPLNAATSLLWIIPLAVVLIGLAVWVLMLKSFSKSKEPDASGTTNSEQDSNNAQAVEQLTRQLDQRND